MADNISAPFEWGTAIDETFNELTQQIIQYFPQLLGTATLLLVGFVIAKTLAVSTHKLVDGLDALFVRMTRTEGAHRERIQRSYAVVASRLVFWLIMLFAFAVSANVLGWNLFSGWLDRTINYLPGLVSGLLIILGGFLLSSVARAGLASATQSAGLEQGELMARAVQVVIVFSAIIIGVEQIGLNIDFLSTIIVVVVGVLLGGAALAFSFGARDLVANVIGAQYIRRHCREGDLLRIGTVEGEIVEVSQASIVLAVADGKVIVPARLFHLEVSHVTPAHSHKLD